MDKLNIRLKTAASFIKKGSVVADIGCDHAYLPIFLIKNNIASRVIAADINEGPCEKARENIRKNSLSKVIKVIRTDGLKGIDEFSPDTVVICGMGGDLITRIVGNSPYTRESCPMLILQPQTKQSSLREYLLSSGYRIIDEAICEDDRLYEIIVAKYDGIKREWNEVELLLGKRNIENKVPLFDMHITKILNQYMTVVNGKKKAGLDTSYEENIIEELEKLKNDGNRII
ncbi:MAG: SAM-dependent methyltransferase [Ruminococcaceae bacterium]|nr:SAM-dependent methyltransferase [Oscillospiraceae bacterium]